MKKLLKEISKFDAGLWIHSSEENKRTSLDKMKTGIGNKMFTYLEAGLPVLVSSSREYGSKLIESNSIGIAVNDSEWNNLRVLFTGYKKKESIKSINKFRRNYSLQQRAHELSDFYSKVIKKK